MTDHNNDAGMPGDQQRGAEDEVAMTKTIDFRVRSPSSSRDFVMTVALDATLSDLHAVIADKYEGRPDEARQTVRRRS